MSGETNVNGLQTHMVGINQLFNGIILNPASSFMLGNVQYHQPYMAQVLF